MKCKDCEYVEKGFFKEHPESYVCIGERHPFVVDGCSEGCSHWKKKVNKGWINCESGNMPEDDEKYKDKKIINVLVTTATGKVTKVQRKLYGDYWRWGRIYGEPKAWMPLPEPYKGE